MCMCVGGGGGAFRWRADDSVPWNAGLVAL